MNFNIFCAILLVYEFVFLNFDLIRVRNAIRKI